MILHSDLTKKVLEFVANNVLLDGGAETLISMTTQGVWPEELRDGDEFVYHAPLPEPTLGKLMDSASAPHPTRPVTSGFVFGKTSQANLNGVHPKLVECATLALSYSRQDFMVFDGLRTLEEQQKMVAKGVSKTMQSMHLMQNDGFGHAVDLVPVVKTLPKWDWELIYPVATAMMLAARQLTYANHIVWGGAWDVRLSDLADMNNPSESVIEYCSRHEGKDFIDGPHYEWRE